MKYYYKIVINPNFIYWGLGIGDWGLGIGDWGLGPIPNPQSPYNLNIQNIYKNIFEKKIYLILYIK